MGLPATPPVGPVPRAARSFLLGTGPFDCANTSTIRAGLSTCELALDGGGESSE